MRKSSAALSVLLQFLLACCCLPAPCLAALTVLLHSPCMQLPLSPSVPVAVTVLLARGAWLGHQAPGSPPYPTSQICPAGGSTASMPDELGSNPSTAAAQPAGISHDEPSIPSSTAAAQAAAICQRRVLHVRSISSWAPSCIGPYSQVCLQCYS